MLTVKVKPKKPGDNQEHDSFIKAFFSVPRWAQELFRLTLPPELYERLDFSRLRVHVGEAALDENGELRSDILYSVPPYGEDWLVYLYFEHSSGDNSGDLLQEIRRKAEVIAKQKSKSDPGCHVISTLLYQPSNPKHSWYFRRKPREKHPSAASGKNSGKCGVHTDIHDILERHGLSGGIYVLDLGLAKPEQLKTDLTMRAGLYTLKYIRAPNFKAKLPRIAEWLEVDAEAEDIELLGKYIVGYLKESNTYFEKLSDKFKKSKLGVETMTLREAFIAEGVKRGVKKERENARKKTLQKLKEEKKKYEAEKLQIAANLLRREVTLDIVLKSTGLTKTRLRKEGVLAK